MMSFHEGVTLFFKIVNVCTTGGVIVYGFKKYCYRSIIAALDEKMRTYENNLAQLDSLKEEQRFLEKLMTDQAQEYQALMTKIGVWNAVLEKKEAERHQQHQIMLHHIYQKQLQQQESRASYIVMQETLPTIMASTQQTLMAEFADKQHARTILQKIIESMDTI